MTLESVETSSKSFMIINFIAKSIRNQHLIRMKIDKEIKKEYRKVSVINRGNVEYYYLK